jgi:hypothetical protein
MVNILRIQNCRIIIRQTSYWLILTAIIASGILSSCDKMGIVRSGLPLYYKKTIEAEREALKQADPKDVKSKKDDLAELIKEAKNSDDQTKNIETIEENVGQFKRLPTLREQMMKLGESQTFIVDKVNLIETDVKEIKSSINEI